VQVKNSSGFASSIESTTQFQCTNGTFYISDFKFVGQPNSTRSVKVRTDGIDYGIPSNEEYKLQKLQSANNSMGNIIYGEAEDMAYL
jgi:hypothetical protein